MYPLRRPKRITRERAVRVERIVQAESPRSRHPAIRRAASSAVSVWKRYVPISEITLERRRQEYDSRVRADLSPDATLRENEARNSSTTSSTLRRVDATTSPRACCAMRAACSFLAAVRLRALSVLRTCRPLSSRSHLYDRLPLARVNS